MSETIVVVGANHAGTAAINTILDHYKDKRVVVFDRGSVISFLGCGDDISYISMGSKATLDFVRTIL